MTEIADAFSMFMNPAKMKTIFQQELPNCVAQGWKFTDCRIQHPRYKTYVNPESRHKSYLAAAYHLRGVNKLQNKTEDKILYVKAYLGERSLAEYRKARTQVQPDHQLVHIEKYGMIAWVFPNDPGLAHLPTVMNTDLMRRYFARFLMAGDEGVAVDINDVALQIVNYRPEIRCTFRYDAEVTRGGIVTLYGKTFCDDKGAEINRRISTFFLTPGNPADRFAFPKPIGYDASLRTLWMEELEGSPLIHQLTSANGPQTMKRLAACLSDLHHSAMPGLTALTQRDQLEELQKKSVKMQSAFPTLAPRIEAIVADLVRAFEHLPDSPLYLSHGDFHIHQLVLRPDGRIGLFDFDELAMASPLTDVANFCADLYNANLGKSLTAALIDHFVGAYRSLSTFDIDTGHFDWHYRGQLLTRAYRAYIQQKPGLDQLVEQFVAEAETGFPTNITG